jgi:hypothetical protein
MMVVRPLADGPPSVQSGCTAVPNQSLGRHRLMAESDMEQAAGWTVTGLRTRRLPHHRDGAEGPRATVLLLF